MRGHFQTYNHNLSAIVGLDEGAYIDEWLEYHVALGFDTIYLNDNTNNFMFQNWTISSSKSKGRIKVHHTPGIGKQVPVYNTCAQRARDDGHRWAAFIDIDEFLVMRKHRHVADFLEEYCEAGAVLLSWLVFGTSNHTEYEPVPVTKRFQYFSPSELTQFVKSIVRLEDFVRFTNVHWAHLRNGTTSKITGGKEFHYPRTQPILTWDIAERKTDVAIIHHYRYKSRNEYIKKKMRGDASAGKCHRLKENETAYAECKELVRKDDLIEAINSDNPTGTVFDDTAWQLLKQNVPKY